MTRIAIVFSLFLAAISAAQTAGGDARTTHLDQVLIGQTEAVAQAQKSKDGETLKRLLADDFQQVGSEGQLHSKEDFIDDAKQGKLTDYSYYNLKVLLIDDSAAIVTRDAVIHGTEGDDVLVPRYQRLSDLWVKQGEQWRLRFQQATPRRPVD